MQRGKISLIGFMGSGKSTVASLLAQALKIDCCEMDDAILLLARSTLGLSASTVAEIIDAHGDTVFRDLEEQVARDLQFRRNLLVSTGGGIIGREQNMISLKEADGVVVFLRTEFQTISQRLHEDSGRPLFRDRSKAKQLYDERLPLYERWSDLTIDTDLLTPVAVCELVLKGLP
jgi:shikimate kinase